MAGMSALAALT